MRDFAIVNVAAGVLWLWLSLKLRRRREVLTAAKAAAAVTAPSTPATYTGAAS